MAVPHGRSGSIAVLVRRANDIARRRCSSHVSRGIEWSLAGDTRRPDPGTRAGVGSPRSWPCSVPTRPTVGRPLLPSYSPTDKSGPSSAWNLRKHAYLKGSNGLTSRVRPRRTRSPEFQVQTHRRFRPCHPERTAVTGRHRRNAVERAHSAVEGQGSLFTSSNGDRSLETKT